MLIYFLKIERCKNNKYTSGTKSPLRTRDYNLTVCHMFTAHRQRSAMIMAVSRLRVVNVSSLSAVWLSKMELLLKLVVVWICFDVSWHRSHSLAENAYHQDRPIAVSHRSNSEHRMTMGPGHTNVIITCKCNWKSFISLEDIMYTYIMYLMYVWTFSLYFKDILHDYYYYYYYYYYC